MRVEIPFILCIMICGIIIAGCTDQSPPKPVATPAPTITASPLPAQVTTIPSPLTVEETKVPSIFDQPISHPPANLTISVTARKDPVYSTISTIFDGGKGQDLVQSILVRTTLSTGEVIEETLAKKKGAELINNGTKGTDRVQVAVTFMDGNSYYISDFRLEPNRSGTTATLAPVTSKTMSGNEEGLYPGPVTEPPNSLSISVDVEKEPIYRVITATFRGGHGQSLISRIEMNTILGTGEAVKKQIANNIGAIAEVQGTDGVDRVQIVVSFKNGETYKILEKTFGSRG